MENKNEPIREVKRFSSEDVFPNHLALSCMGYIVDIGSFSLSMYELRNIALDCILCMKRIENDEELVKHE